MEASLDTPSVNTVSLYAFDNLFEVFNTLTTWHKVVCRVTNKDWIIVAALTMNFVNDISKETAAVFSRSAIFVSTMVRVLRNKAHNHVTNTSMDLNDIDASLLTTKSSVTILLNNQLDFFFGEFAFWHTNERTRNNVFRRSVAQKLMSAIWTPLIAELQLSSELSAVLVANLRGAGQTWNKAVVPNTYRTSSGVIFRMGVKTVANVARAELDKSSSTFCTLFVEITQVIAYMIIISFLDSHRKHDKAISQFHIADFKRRVKFFVLHCTAPFYRTCVNLLSFCL